MQLFFRLSEKDTTCQRNSKTSVQEYHKEKEKRNEKIVVQQTILRNQTLGCTHVNKTHSAVGNENGTFERKPCSVLTPVRLKNFCAGIIAQSI